MPFKNSSSWFSLNLNNFELLFFPQARLKPPSPFSLPHWNVFLKIISILWSRLVVLPVWGPEAGLICLNRVFSFLLWCPFHPLLCMRMTPYPGELPDSVYVVVRWLSPDWGKAQIPGGRPNKAIVSVGKCRIPFAESAEFQRRWQSANALIWGDWNHFQACKWFTWMISLKSHNNRMH